MAILKRKRKYLTQKLSPTRFLFHKPNYKRPKIYAGKLIEGAGLKGAKIGKIIVSPNNALILTNPNKAGFEELMNAEKFIIKKVFNKFGITLKREPKII